MTSEEIPCSMSYEEGAEQPQQTSDIHTLIWKITNFNELPLVVNFCEDSEQLVFKGTGWCIRTYPNGMSENGSEGWICHVMRRTSTLAPKQNILCKFGIKDNNGGVKIMAERVLEKNDRELGPIKLFEQSEACKSENNFLLAGTITMVCKMRYIEGTEEEEEETDFYEIPPSVYDEMQVVGILSSVPESGQRVTWKLPHFTAMPVTDGYFVVSPTFQFRGTSCFMRLYPNGLREIETEGWICIELEMSDFLARKQRIFCEIGVKDRNQIVTARQFITEDGKLFGPVPTWKRSMVENYNLEDGSIIAVCIIAVLDQMK